MVPLFCRYALSRAQAEERLGRPITGDPNSGERAALQALADMNVRRCRTLLSAPGIGADFRALILERLEQATKREGRHFVVSALVNGNAYDHYARLARLQGVPISSVVATALERDFATARALRTLDSEPVLPTLMSYLRELLELLQGVKVTPDLALHLARLADLQAGLAEAALPLAGDPP